MVQELMAEAFPRLPFSAGAHGHGDRAAILNAQRLASASGAVDSRLSWVGAPTVRETLAARERISTSGRFLWEDGRIAGNVALATPDAPASTLLVGDFAHRGLVRLNPIASGLACLASRSEKEGGLGADDASCLEVGCAGFFATLAEVIASADSDA